ncbi:MAG: DUF2267 domain-containing protein, partial [Planctomycetota bacterium]
MPSHDIHVINSNLQKLDVWLHQLQEELHLDPPFCFQALRAVLHMLRDRITVEEAAHFGAQLPLIIRGLFFENWHPAGTPERIRHADEFFQRISELEGHGHDPHDLFRAVIRVLHEHLSEGQLEQVRHMLPKEIAEEWQAVRS